MAGIKGSVSKVDMPKKNAVLTKAEINNLYYDAEQVLGVKIDKKQTSAQDIQRLLKKIHTARTSVGSVNPYAAIEHEMGVKIDWESSEPGAIEKLLSKKGDDPFRIVVKNPVSGSPKKIESQKKPDKNLRETKL
jgi:hypothetical protein